VSIKEKIVNKLSQNYCTNIISQKNNLDALSLQTNLYPKLIIQVRHVENEISLIFLKKITKSRETFTRESFLKTIFIFSFMLIFFG